MLPTIVLKDSEENRHSLLPLTFTRPIGLIRIGIFTIIEKWEALSGAKINHFITTDYLQSKFPSSISQDILVIQSNVLPTKKLWEEISRLQPGDQLFDIDNQLLAFRKDPFSELSMSKTFAEPVRHLRFPWQIFQWNGEEIRNDLKYLIQSEEFITVSDSYTKIYNEKEVFVHPSAKIKAAVLNAENGPIYIGKNTEIQEGTLIRGPFALGENSVVNMGAKIKGDTSIGPHCKVGGEISNSILFGYSNKAHDGFLGNAVIGEWCNLGADTNNSNLKNNYANVKIWQYPNKKFIDTGLQFCGLIMGDHAKAGINTMFNTGTIVGVGANVFGEGFPRNFIPDFSWGGSGSYQTFTLAKFFETAQLVMNRRNVTLTDTDKEIFHHIFNLTKEFRNWEKP